MRKNVTVNCPVVNRRNGMNWLTVEFYFCSYCRGKLLCIAMGGYLVGDVVGLRVRICWGSGGYEGNPHGRTMPLGESIEPRGIQGDPG